MGFPTVFIKFETRHDRSEFIAKYFSKYLVGSILDVGCFEAPLRKLIKNGSYVGIDIAGDPDIRLNLETIESLPFPDGSFDLVLCIDVLEHLDNLHFIFGELIRVSKKYILISLPNCWRDARKPISRGKGHFKHYGLPASKPTDRHKWFFNISEARDFILSQSNQYNFFIKELFVTEKPKWAPIRVIRHIRYPGIRYHNRYSNTLWALLEKYKKSK